MPPRRLDPDLPPMPPERVRAWREGLGLTQAEAAESLGISRATFQRYEYGEYQGEVSYPKPVPLALRLAMAALTARLDPAD